LAITLPEKSRPIKTKSFPYLFGYLKVLGFNAKNNFLFLRNPELPKDLSNSNVVTVNRSEGIMP
jgi:hypothetical protein